MTSIAHRPKTAEGAKFYTSYQRLAKIYGQKDGINVIVKGEGFATDTDKTILIAEIPEALNKRLKNPTLAGLLHECGHIVHDDGTRIKNNEIYKTHHGLVNNIQDIRLLFLNKHKYPGALGLQHAGLEFLKPGLKEGMSTGLIDIPAMLGICIQYMESNEDTSWFPKQIQEMAEITKDLWTNQDWKSEMAGQLQAENITKRIIERIKLERSKSPPPNQKGGKRAEESEGEKEEGDKSGEGKTNSKEQGETEGKEENKEKGNNNKGEKEQGKRETEQEKEKSQGKGETEQSANLNPEEGEQEGADGEEGDAMSSEEEPKPEKNNIENQSIEEAMEDLVEGNMNHTKAGQEQTKGDIWKELENIITQIIQTYKRENKMHTAHPLVLPYDKEGPIEDPLKNSPTPETIEKIRMKLTKVQNDVDSEVKKLRSRLLPLLVAEKKSSFLFEQKEGEIDDGGLYRLRAGNRRVFKQRAPGKKTNTAVCLLNDCSGSMGGPKMEMLRACLLTLADSLYAAKVPYEIITFSTFDSDEVMPHATCAKVMDDFRNNPTLAPNRIDPLRHEVIKSYDQNYPTVRHLIPLIFASEFNCDNEAFKFAYERLIVRKEERKILFVLSDGMPNIRYGADILLEEDLLRRVKMAEQEGVEVIGIGIMQEDSRKFYPTFRLIESTEQISKGVYECLMEKLMNPNVARKER